MKINSVMTVLLIAAMANCGGCSTSKADDLRAFGKIAESTSQFNGLDLTVFACENADKAVLLAHKLGRDMQQSATVPARWEQVRLGDSDANVLVREGIGSFLPAASGADLLVFTSPKTTDLGAVFAPAAAKLRGARFFDPSFKYPVLYDKFSSAGIGSWYPAYWGDAETKGKPNTVDDHFAFAKKYDLTVQPSSADFMLRNLLPKLHEYLRPYHIAQWLEWSQDFARMAPDELVMPNDKFSTMPHYYGQISDGGQKLLQYRNWCFQNLMREFVGDPALVDWLDPNGEVGPAPFFYYWDFSEGNRQNLVRYLRDGRNYTPETLGSAWYGDAARFPSWDDVKIPMDYDFFGYQAGDILANKLWRIHPTSPDSDTNFNNGNWTQATNGFPANLRRDIENGYPSIGLNDSGWAEISRPGGELASIYWSADSKHFNKFFWQRGTIDVAADWLDHARKSGRVYLTAAALNVNRGPKEPDRLWVNGVETAALSASPGSYTIAQLDVTDVVKPGRNLLVHLANETNFSSDGPWFLTTRKMESYPFSDPLLNARYHDWREYITWAVNEKMENTYKAIRGVDPDRFIKMMAAERKDLSIALASEYGCYPHNTGEGSFFRPWDKRFGYVYGIPSSAEFGGGVVEPKAWKRWLGWFIFEGNNAFDNFHNIQEMMYSPAAKLWAQYMPYLKLANRYDIKRPQIALFWSSENDLLLPRPEPYYFDLGRGDLQFIGQSYVYVDEMGVKNGLLKNYPVVWDTGTWIMDPATVAGLKQYVEDGGTFVALQETGRHTFTQRDAWPIDDLTGFKVREIRPMTGTISILADQPLFTKLAGRNFNNRGKSIDYSDFNSADKCLALDPVAADTCAVARYDDGSIAIGMRKLGKGRVIVLGSPFWRDSYDGAGMWWPGESQSEFLEDILNGLGVNPVAKADTHDVWREHYLADNGTEEYLALFNPFDTPRTFSLQWKTVHPALALFDPKDGEKIDGRIDGNTVTLDHFTLDGLQTVIVAAQTQTDPQLALNAWFKQLAWWWRPSAPGSSLTRPDLPCYTMQLAPTMKGKVMSAGELAGMDIATLSKTSDPGVGFEPLAGQSVEEFRGKPDDDRRIVLHCPLVLPQQWSSKDKIELVVSRLNPGGSVSSLGRLDAYVSGVKVISQNENSAAGRAGIGSSAMRDGVVADVTGVLDFKGPNAVCIVVSQTGFVGQVELRRHPAVAQTLDVAGVFHVQLDADSGVGQAAVPGIVKGLYAWKDDLLVPAAWQGSEVFVEINVANLPEYECFAINDKVVFHPVDTYKPVTWMDITPWVKFGQPNKLTLISRNATRDWAPGSPDYRSIKLLRVDRGNL